MTVFKNYKHKESGERVEVRKLPRVLTYPKVFYEVKTTEKVGYVALKDFKQQYELIEGK